MAIGLVAATVIGIVAFTSPTTDPQSIGPGALVVFVACAACPLVGSLSGAITWLVVKFIKRAID
ncbi:MAG: hypothetical protein CMJ78_07725 [Planctomycetaceae bacterium]|nr:hypothetical protein [Planctomycetaceae bacterium]